MVDFDTVYGFTRRDFHVVVLDVLLCIEQQGFLAIDRTSPSNLI